MSKTKLSIIIPTFNSENRISALVKNICETLSIDFEIVIVDDCSTDRTREIITYLSQENESVRCIYQSENVGPGVARDVAFKTIESEFVIFFDDDDIFYGGNVEYVLKKMEIYDVSVSIMAYEYIDTCNISKNLGMLLEDACKFDDILQDSNENIIQPSVYPRISSIINFPWNKICKTDYLKNIDAKFGSLRLHEDIPIHWNILCNADYIFLTRKPIGQHILDTGMRNASRKIHKNRDQVLDALRGAYYFLNMSKNRNDFIVDFYDFQANIISWAYNYIPFHEKNIFSRKVSDLFREMKISDLNMIFNKNRHLYHRITNYLKNYR